MAREQSREEIHQLVRAAILGKRPLSVVYDGRSRRLCPHILGRTRGQLRVLCYQYEGDSKAGLRAEGSPANWRCVVLDRLSEVVLVGDHWRTADMHSRRQTCIEKIELDVGIYAVDA